MNASMVLGQQQQGEYARKFPELSGDVLFGDIWERTPL